MTRQTELDRQWHETGYDEMGIGFNHEPTDPRTDYILYDLSKPITPADAHGTAKGIIREMEEPQPQDVLTCEDYDPEEYDPGHDLDAAKGMVNGCIIGLIMWAGIIWALTAQYIQRLRLP